MPNLDPLARRELPQLDRSLTPHDTTGRWGRRLGRRGLAPAVAVALTAVVLAAPAAAQVANESTTTTAPEDTTTTAPGGDTTTTTAPEQTTTTVDPYAAGVPVTTVEGDSTSTTAPVTGSPKKPGHVKDVQGDGVSRPASTGGVALIDGHHFKYFVNTDITFSTSSSASAAMSEGSFTEAVDATTANGGTVASTLNDAFDGYNTLCIDVAGANGTCETGNTNYVIYNKLGAKPTMQCSDREAVFPIQQIGVQGLLGLEVQRKVYVPAGGDWARWLNSFTNTGAVPLTFRMAVSNNLGSDSNTIVTASSNGGTTVNTSTKWVGTMQNYSGTTSSDPRLGHVLAGTNGAVGLHDVNFTNGDDNPFWGYSITVPAGQTVTIADFVTAQGSKAVAATRAASLSQGTQSGQWACLSDTQKAQVANFELAVPPPSTTTTEAPTTTAAPTTEAAPTSEAAAAVTPSGSLPYTGADLTPLIAGGAAILGAGGAAAGAATVRRRRFLRRK